MGVEIVVGRWRGDGERGKGGKGERVRGGDGIGRVSWGESKGRVIRSLCG